MKKIDGDKINHYVLNSPRPAYCEVSDDEWRDALLGAQEALSNGDLDGLDTDGYWTHIWLSAVYFCKGMMWAETKAGLRPETMYPRY